jgi:hypothetical protein
MKNPGYPLIIFILLLLSACKQAPDYKVLFNYLESEFSAGNLFRVKTLSDSIKTICPDNKQLVYKSDSITQIAERIKLDFPFSENIIDQQLHEKIGAFNAEEKANWEKTNWLECRIINGEKRYFSRAVSNLDLIKSFNLNRTERDSIDATDPEMIYRKKHTQSIIKESGNKTDPVIPVNMTVNYTITVYPDAVPAGEIVRCRPMLKIFMTGARSILKAPAGYRLIYLTDFSIQMIRRQGNSIFQGLIHTG